MMILLMESHKLMDVSFDTSSAQITNYITLFLFAVSGQVAGFQLSSATNVPIT